MIQKLGNITRLTVLDATGRIYERRGIEVKVSVQDEGRTLKIYVEDPPEPRVSRLRRRSS